MDGVWDIVLDDTWTPSYDVVVTAVILLSLVDNYLTGNEEIGTTKAYSRSSLDFRDVYVSIVVLFLGAVVWIWFRGEVARVRGVYRKEVKDKYGRITNVVYQPRFKPPRENGRAFDWIYLGQYPTPEEASILYQIATLYYKESPGGSLDLGDGGKISIPPMSDLERSLKGIEKRAWVKDQVMRVYEQFKKERTEAALLLLLLLLLLQEPLVPWEDEGTQVQDKESADLFAPSSWNSAAEQQQPALAIPVENLGMGILFPDDSQDVGFSIGPTHDFQGGHVGIPVSPLTDSGVGIVNSHPVDSLVQEQISFLEQQLSFHEQQISGYKLQIQKLRDQSAQRQYQQRMQQPQLQEPWMQHLQFPNECSQQQQLQEPWMQHRQFPNECSQQQQLQDIDYGVSVYEVEMEPSAHHPNYSIGTHSSAT